MFRSVFNRFSKKPGFKGDLIPLNDPVFDILRASEIGRGLLALNDDADQRIYRSPYNNLAQEPSMDHTLMHVSGYYIPKHDSVLIAKSVRANSIIDEAFVITHELAHRLQHKYHKSLKKKYSAVNGYEKIMATLLKEMHANNIADLVLMQVYESYKDSANRSQKRLAIGIQNHMRGRPVSNIANDNYCRKDITPVTSQNFFTDNFESRLSALDAYIYADLQRLNTYQKSVLGKSQIALLFAPASALAMGSSILFSGDGLAASLMFGLQGVALGGLSVFGYRLNKRRFNNAALNSKSIDHNPLFEHSAVKIVPTDQVDRYIEWAANDNQPDYLDLKIEMMKKRIDLVREKVPLLGVLPISGKEVRGNPPPPSL